MATTDDLLRELTEMKERLAAAEARIAELDTVRQAPLPDDEPVHRRGDLAAVPDHVAAAEEVDDPQPRATDRRGLLKGAGIAAGAAVAAVGATVATASPAAAANGDPLTLGVTNNQATSPTKSYNASSTTHLFQFVDDPGVTPSTSNGYAALAGAASAIPIGTAGFSSSNFGSGVYGEATGTGGIAVWANASGTNSTGVQATGGSTGVYVLMPTVPNTVGVQVAGGAAGIAVGSVGRGISIDNTTTPLHIGPGSGTSAPSAAALLGDIYADSNGVLYYCTAAGTPGTWVRLTGPGTAGAFTAITPTRVYDSRISGGRLSNGQTRVVSVANGINVSSGVVTTPDLVPAGATAIQYNLTVVDTTGSGYLQVAPGDASAITSSSINWTATGQIIANGLMVKIDASRQVKAFAMIGSTNFILDVLGYYL
jgi:hypothetical protein